MKLRTVKQCYNELKLQDPNSAITIYCIRKWCKEGKIKCVYSGCKLLLDYASFDNFMHEMLKI